MTTYNTGNPIGSTDARDRLDNSENLDLAVNSLAQTFVDRLGVTRDTLEGIYQKSAYYRAGTFDAGYTLTNNRQTLTYGNIEYSWSGSFPKVVPAGATPATAGGVGAGAWVDRTDSNLRSDLSSDHGSSIVKYKYDDDNSIARTVQDRLRENASPEDWGHVIDPVATTYPYNADIPVDVLRGTESEKFALTLAKTLAFTDYPNFKLNERIKNAFISGVVRVAVVGDSISAGADNWRSNTYATLLKTKLKQQFPWVTFEFNNMAIGGMSAGTLNSDSYVGVSTYAEYVLGTNFWFPRTHGGINENLTIAPTGYALLDEDYWKGGSVAGKTWKQHIVDYAPDLIVWAFGMNDGTDYETFLYNYETFQTYIKTQMSASVPWFTLVSCFLPDKNPPNGQPHAAWQLPAQCMADQLKYIAARDSYGLIDANAIFNLLRDGLRYDYAPYTHEANWRYATDTTKWAYGAGLVYDSGLIAASGTGMAVRKIETRDFDFSGTFNVTAFNANNFVGRFIYRGNDQTPGSLTGYAVDLVLNSTTTLAEITVYWRTTIIYSATYDQGQLPVVGHKVAFKVKCYGAKHEIWLDDILVLEFNNYHSFYRGPVQIGIPQGAGYVQSIGLSYADGWAEGPVDFDRKWLLGTPIYSGGVFQAYGDFITNPDSMGGNVVNHPTAWGHNTFYGFGIMRFIDELKQRVNERVELTKIATSTFTVTAAANVHQLVSTLPAISIKTRKYGKYKVTLNVTYSVAAATGMTQAGIFVNGVFNQSSYIPMSTQNGGIGVRQAVVDFNVTLNQGINTIAMSAARNSTAETYIIGEAGTSYSISVCEL